MMIIWLLLFLLVCWLSFSLPGLFLINYFKIPLQDRAEKLFVGTVTGMVLFTLAAYGLSAVHLRMLMYVFPLVGLFLLIKDRLWLRVHRFPKASPLFLTLFIIGMIGQVVVNAPSGWLYGDGLRFYSSHGHDGIWHLALMTEMKKNVFPFQNPEFAGHQLQNYHFFVDLLMSELARLFYFSDLDIYFRLMPVVFSLLLGSGGYLLAKRWSGKVQTGLWAMVMIYFTGSFGYILTWFADHRIGGESLFWVSQTQSVLGNPPHAAAFVILAALFILLHQQFQKPYWPTFWLITILGGAVIEFKVYAGVLILGGLFVTGIWQGLRHRQWQILWLFCSTLVVALIIYLPNSANSQDFLIWQPWWFIRTMVVAPDRLNWLDLELRRQTYIADHNWKRVVELETIAFLIFLIGNLGMRVAGFWHYTRKLIRGFQSSSFDLFFIAITTAAFLIPVLFVQKGVAWNAIQFNQYFLYFFGFLAAFSYTSLMGKISGKIKRTAVIVIILLLAVPTQLGLLWQFYSNAPLSKISNQELAALNYLHDHSNENDIILTAPFNQYAAADFGHPPIPIEAWYDTGYVPAMSGRQTWLSDQEQLDIMGYDIHHLLDERKAVFLSGDNQVKNDFLQRNHIAYIYLGPKQQFATSSVGLKADVVFSNQDAKIYRVF